MVAGMILPWRCSGRATRTRARWPGRQSTNWWIGLGRATRTRARWPIRQMAHGLFASGELRARGRDGWVGSWAILPSNQGELRARGRDGWKRNARHPRESDGQWMPSGRLTAWQIFRARRRGRPSEPRRVRRGRCRHRRQAGGELRRMPPPRRGRRVDLAFPGSRFQPPWPSGEDRSA